jgi:hypothetical protein
MEEWNKMTPSMAMHDHTHLSRKGYEVVSGLLYASLMRSYESYLKSAPSLPPMKEKPEVATSGKK